MQISTIGIDIGKNSFHFVGFDARGGIVVRRQCSRTQSLGMAPRRQRKLAKKIAILRGLKTD